MKTSGITAALPDSEGNLVGLVPALTAGRSDPRP